MTQTQDDAPLSGRIAKVLTPEEVSELERLRAENARLKTKLDDIHQITNDWTRLSALSSLDQIHNLSA